MIDYKTFYKIPFFNGKKIVDIITLSNSFGAFCGKIKLSLMLGDFGQIYFFCVKYGIVSILNL